MTTPKPVGIEATFESPLHGQGEGFIKIEDFAAALGDTTALKAATQVAVETSLGSSSTVGAAVASALDGALDDAGLLRSERITENSVEFASVDEPEKPLFKFSEIDDVDTGWRFAAAYANGEVAFGVKADGSYYPPVATAPVKVAGPDFYAPGDSLTVGSGGNGTSYVSVLNTLLAAAGYPGIVRPGGVGGEPSRTIAARAGGRPMLAAVDGGVLPASGSVGVTLTADAGGTVQPLQQGTANAGINPVTVGGVQWNLVRDGTSGLYSLSRITPGAAIPADYPMPLLTEARTSRRGDILLMQWGQNDATELSTDPGGLELISRLKAQIEWQDAAQKKYLVLGFVTGGIAGRKTIHDNMRQAFGRRFVNVLEFMLTPAAFRIAGITPTADDQTAIAAGSKPPSFWASTTPGDTDSIHNNALGYTVTAHAVFNRLKELGDI